MRGEKKRTRLSETTSSASIPVASQPNPPDVQPEQPLEAHREQTLQMVLWENTDIKPIRVGTPEIIVIGDSDSDEQLESAEPQDLLIISDEEGLGNEDFTSLNENQAPETQQAPETPPEMHHQTPKHQHESSSAAAPTTQQPKHVKEWARTRLRAAYLEESEHKIFVHTVRQLDPEKVVAAEGFHGLQQVEYICMMRKQGQHPSLVQTRKELRFVKKVEMKKILSVWYPIFTVVQDDG